jgi:hypothetical protein
MHSMRHATRPHASGSWTNGKTSSITDATPSRGSCLRSRSPAIYSVAGAGVEFLIGFTRLGSLLALLLDREEVSEIQKHLMWVGRGNS